MGQEQAAEGSNLRPREQALKLFLSQRFGATFNKKTKWPRVLGVQAVAMACIQLSKYLCFKDEFLE